jgi:hypothetical protein
MTTSAMIIIRGTGLLLLLLAGLGLPGRASAEGGFPPAFVVADVPADASGKDGVAAREQARGQSEMAAFRTLLERLTQPADWQHLPQLDLAAVTDLLVDVQVTNEHASAQRYVASLTFRFNPKGVRDLLRNAGIPFSELASKPVVIVPVLDADGEAHLWDDPNPWRDAWNAVPGRSGIVPWVVPAGDLADVTALDHPDIDHPRPEQLQALSQRYDDGDIVIAHATLTRTDGQAHLDITVARYAGGDTADSQSVSVDGPAADRSLYLAGVAAAVKLLEQAWKRQLPSDAASVGPARIVEVSVPIAGPAEWSKIRSKLASVPVVRAVNVELLARREVRVKLSVSADPATLALALAQQDLVVNETTPIATLGLRTHTAETSPS